MINYLYGLLATISIELVVAFLFSLRKKEEVITVICINLITNPILNFVILIYYQYSSAQLDVTCIAVLEIIIILTESGLLTYALQKRWLNMLALSAVMNLCSFFAGSILLGI